jgi:hypothetical protein
MGMCLIIAALALFAGPMPPPPAAARVERIQITARIVRGAEASERRRLEHQTNRVRIVVDKQPDGRQVYVTVLDFE